MSLKGKVRKASDNKNCLFCKRFSRCRDNHKDFDFLCSRFIRKEKVDLSNLEIEGEDNPFEDQLNIREDIDFESLVENTLSEELPTPSDMRIDDRDFPKAKNFIEFCGPKFLDMDIELYAKQIEIALNAYAEYCPYCSKPGYATNIPFEHKISDILNNIQLLEYGKCPKCKRVRSDLFKEGHLYPITSIVAALGQRSGKSAVTSVIGAYTLHQFLKIPNPANTLGLLKNSWLRGNIIALDLNQAKAVWDPLMGHITESPWFIQYNNMLEDYGKRYGEVFYKQMDTFVLYNHKKISYRLSAPNKRALRGDTRVYAVIDELGWFDANKSDSVKFSADEIYTSLNNSFRTVRSAYIKLWKDGYNDIPPPMFCNIGSPSSSFDKISRLVKESKNSKTIFARNYATWEANPNITFEELQEEFKNDPDTLWRDFGAVPPLSTNPFFQDIKQIRPCIDSSRKNCFLYTQKLIPSISGVMRTSANLSFNWADKIVPKILTIDAGSTDNSFALCLAHKTKGKDEYIVDGMIDLIPEGNPVDFTNVFTEIILKIIKEFGVVLTIADRWNSIKILHDIEKEVGIETIETKGSHRIQYTDFVAARNSIMDGTTKFPKPEIKPGDIETAGGKEYPKGFLHKPLAHFVFQCLTVQDNGKTVDKGSQVTDDLFRTYVTCLKFLQNPEFSKKLEGFVAAKKTITAIGAVSSGSKSSSGGSSIGAVSSGSNSGNSSGIGSVSRKS